MKKTKKKAMAKARITQSLQPKHVPLFKVRMSEQSLAHVARVLTSGTVAEGPEVERFEAELTAYLRIPDSHKIVTVSSGTAALDLAYHLCGIRRGANCGRSTVAVITTPVTCSATNLPLIHRGASILWADVDPATGLISPQDVLDVYETRGDQHVGAVVGVDWAGQICDFWSMRQALSARIPLIEDAAHDLTPIVDMSRRGDFICYSFQAIKHVTCGDGGALVVPAQFYTRAKRLRWFGLDRSVPQHQRYWQTIQDAGFKYHMNDVAAAIGRGNLATVQDALVIAQQNFAHYREYLRHSMPDATWFYPWHVFQREAFVQAMERWNIHVSAVHSRNDRHGVLRHIALPRHRPLDGVDQFTMTNIGLPMGWWVTPDDVARIAERTQDWNAQHHGGAR